MLRGEIEMGVGNNHCLAGSKHHNLTNRRTPKSQLSAMSLLQSSGLEGTFLVSLPPHHEPPTLLRSSSGETGPLLWNVFRWL